MLVNGEPGPAVFREIQQGAVHHAVRVTAHDDQVSMQGRHPRRSLPSDCTSIPTEPHRHRLADRRHPPGYRLSDLRTR
jgi:hypothetical protein